MTGKVSSGYAASLIVFCKKSKLVYENTNYNLICGVT